MRKIDARTGDDRWQRVAWPGAFRIGDQRQPALTFINESATFRGTPGVKKRPVEGIRSGR